MRLRACETTDNLVLRLLAQGYLIQHFREELCVKLLEVLRHRGDEAASHVGTAWAHRKVIRTVGEVVMRTMRGTKHNYRAVLPIGIPRHKIEQRFTLPLRSVGTVEKSVENLCG